MKVMYRNIPEKQIPFNKTDEGYTSFWDNEWEKVKNGVTIDGFKLSGWLYWHLNHWKLTTDDASDPDNINSDINIITPDLRDNELVINNALLRAEEERKGLCIMGLRQMGKTSFESSYGGRSGVVFKNSQNLIMGTSDDDLNNITASIDFGLLNCTPYFRIPRITRDWGAERVQLGVKNKSGDNLIYSTYVIRNTGGGKKTEKGAGVSNLKSNLWDEIGKDDFLSALTATKPAMLGVNGWRTIPICTGTGGNVVKAQDAKKLFFNPSTHSFLEFTQDDGTVGGLFMPGWYRQDCKYKTTLAQYLLDSNQLKEIPENSELWEINIQVSDKEKAIEKIKSELDAYQKSNDTVEYNRWKAYYPLTVDDVFLTESNNKFPKEAIEQRIKWLENHYKPLCVDFFRNSRGIVEWRHSELKPLTKFPITPTDFKEAPVCIYEPPVRDAPTFTYTIGCLPPGEKVMTSAGLKDIEEVSLSDKLINENGFLVNIKNTQKYLVNEEDTYELKVANTYRTTKFTKEHPILVSKEEYGNMSYFKAKKLGLKARYKKFNFNYKTVDSIEVGNWIKVPNIYKKNIESSYEHFWTDFDSRKDFNINNPLNNKDFWWFVGLWLGDGWCESDESKVTICFNKKESLYIEKFENVCKNLFSRSSFLNKDTTNCLELAINFKQLSKFLTQNFGKYAHGKIIPEWVKYLNPLFKQELLRGYLNSDGCVNINTKGYLSTEFVSINLELLESFQDILFSLGFTSSITKLRNAGTYTFKSGKKCNTKTCYHLRLCNNESVNFLTSMFDIKDLKINKVSLAITEQNSKKRERDCFLSEDLEYIYFKILDIKKDKYSGYVYNFECDTHTFMCHHITTHNCDPINNNESNDKIVSLASIRVYKRMLSPLDDFKNQFVCTWAGRYNELKDFHELALMIAEYYNAIGSVLPEASENTLIQYFKFKRKAHFFADSTDLQRNVINSKTKSSSKIGLPPSVPNQRHYMNIMVEEANEEIIDVNDDGDEVFSYGVSKEYDIMYLTEMLNYRGKTTGGVHDGNYDRIISGGCALTLAKYFDTKFPITNKLSQIQQEERYNYVPKTKQTPFGRIEMTPKTQFGFEQPYEKPKIKLPTWLRS